MAVITRVIVSLILILLVSCAQHQTTPDQIICEQECAKRFESCCALCVNNCKNCSMCTTQSAAKSYNKYKKRQCIQGEMMARELQSYRDPLQCRKTTCACHADYRVCMQSCAGVIHKRLQVPPTCC